MSYAFLAAGAWWAQYLTLRPLSIFSVFDRERRQVITWQDAAGASRWVAAVICVQGKYYWTRLKTPEELWKQLQPRDDDQIGFQELLGVLLALGTFTQFLKGSLWVSFIDNMGVMYCVRNATGAAPEIALAVGKLWLQLADMQTDLHGARVESKANIADGPTRDDLSYLHQLRAQFVEPALPSWIYNIWEFPVGMRP